MKLQEIDAIFMMIPGDNSANRRTQRLFKIFFLIVLGLFQRSQLTLR
jgi:hypothetical protein